jgi:hypothetical protein
LQTKHLQLSDPGIVTSVGEDRNGFRVTLKAGKPALWTWRGVINVRCSSTWHRMSLVKLDVRTGA